MVPLELSVSEGSLTFLNYTARVVNCAPKVINGKQSTVNISLDGSMYPGQKLPHTALGKKNHYS
jgi:hypothetical protein